MVLKPSSLRAPSPKRGDIDEAQSSNNSTPFASPMKPSQSLSSPAFGDSSAASGAPTSSLNSTPGNSLAGSPFHSDAPQPVHKKRAYGNPVFCRSPGKVESTTQHRGLTGHASFYGPAIKPTLTIFAVVVLAAGGAGGEGCWRSLVRGQQGLFFQPTLRRDGAPEPGHHLERQLLPRGGQPRRHACGRWRPCGQSPFPQPGQGAISPFVYRFPGFFPMCC